MFFRTLSGTGGPGRLLVCHDETPYAQMHHRAFMAATATKKVSAHSSSIRGIPCTWAPSPAPDRHRSGRWSGVGKRRWKAGHMKRARNSGTGTSADGQSIVNLDRNKLTEVCRAFNSDTVSEYVSQNGQNLDMLQEVVR